MKKKQRRKVFVCGWEKRRRVDGLQDCLVLLEYFSCPGLGIVEGLPKSLCSNPTSLSFPSPQQQPSSVLHICTATQHSLQPPHSRKLLLRQRAWVNHGGGRDNGIGIERKSFMAGKRIKEWRRVGSGGDGYFVVRG
ncbi:hypothetical protein CCACVL1_30238 [Corchorus capsularis]|uniref:Uncharacterized protein n=1 Tax=Corchorus capsularis TaxID=210143 RepID=A0A1R3FYB5_COCAP|nr:hypothetical protein CCACVL1_30238 [Corchorus capsularis]